MTTTPIEVELNNIKHSAFASQETHCYEASLLIDGEKIGTVSNDGHGGADMFFPAKGETWDDYKAAEARCAAELPAHDMTDIGMPGHTIPASLEVECAERVNEWLRRKDMKRLLNTKLAYFKSVPTAPGAPLYVVPLKGYSVEQHSTLCLKRYPDAVILNTLPEAAALALYALAA